MNPAEALLPREPEPGTPVFAEPWHAEVLALAFALSESGLFTAGEWAEALGAAIRRSGAGGEGDTETAYYGAALRALEALVSAKSPETGAALASRVEAWRRAYENTPHGKPVELAAGLGGRRHGHDR